MNEVNDQTYIDKSRKYKIIRIKALDKCTGRHFVYLILTVILACIVIAVYVNTDTEHYKTDKVLLGNELIPYIPESLEFMSPINDRSIEIFALGAKLFVSSTVTGVAGYIASVTCVGGSVFGGISGTVTCIPSIVIYLKASSIAAGLVGNALEALASGPGSFEMSQGREV